ncbi:hypothetical protein GOBAR_AA00322 [Gossypium barbadense]|uniref:Uncharacterized protein n=1 Tax=Gossypium barbadense TaxID=3634 RepID=A0A2P5YXJ6_GOSBA|nr:hypothetical protein GOBAR_AA00322 [Gossypium barbadense]
MESTECEGGDEGDLVNRSTKKVRIRQIEEDQDVVMDTTPAAEKDYERVLCHGPWVVFGQYLTVQSLTMDFNPAQPYPSTVMAWIRLPGLPGHIHYGHMKEICPKGVTGSKEFGIGIIRNMREQRQSSGVNKEEAPPNPETYRPWMLAERWGRHTVRIGRKDGENIRRKTRETIQRSRIRTRGHPIEFSSMRGSVKANGSRKGRKLNKVIKEKGSPLRLLLQNSHLSNQLAIWSSYYKASSRWGW